jgi:O-antigen/teichoic acid export membrane protein
LLFLFFRAGTPFAVIGAIEIASVAAAALYCLYIARYRLKIPLPRPALHPGHPLDHFRQGLPIGLTELAWAFMWYFATVVLGLIFEDESLGWFGASHRMLMALHTFVWLYFFNLLPSIARSTGEPPARLLSLLGPSMRFVAWTSVFGAFVMTVFAREALILAYGPAFAGGAGCLAVLMWILPVAMLSGHYRYTLIAYNLQNRLLYCTAVSAAIAVGAGAVLVPLFGATGAAFALLIANVSIFALVHSSVRRLVVEVPFAGYLVRPVVGLAVGTAVLFLLARWNIWIAGTAGAAGYISVLALSQGRHFVSLARTVFAKKPVTEESLAG